MNINFGRKGSVTIDGRTFSGNNISISGDKVIIDGVQQEGSLVGDVHVSINGDVEALQITSGSITVTAGSIKTTSGDVKCGDVSGSVQTVSGDVACGNVAGNIRTVSGDVK
jgi:hypothetical protein